jgi:starch synthase
MNQFPAIKFEPDGYVLDGPKLMGRQAAGHGFLRALIAAADRYDVASLYAVTPFLQSAQIFERILADSSKPVRAGWIPSDRPDQLARHGALFIPGPGLGDAGFTRLRANPAAWSITGITHTLCSHIAMDAITQTLSAPVMPWDALICTSTVAQKSVSTLFQLQAEYLAWRFGVSQFTVPKLPVIPLGVHSEDFTFSEDSKRRARRSLKLADTDVVVLFSGRLTFHAKAHPFPMFGALEEAARRSGKDVVLLLCGQFPNEAVHKAFLQAAKSYAPSLKTVWVDGKDATAYNQAWAASNLFVSLSDNLQETFGITPIEAMASGLPVIVSDWDGYKDTVCDGETGYRIPTWMPPPDMGMMLANAFEAGTINYDKYIGLSCLEVSLDNAVLVDRLYQLISDPALCVRMGAAGREHVAQHYDWSVVILKYTKLWLELGELRQSALKDASASSLLRQAPKCAPARQDPYRVFASFPTRILGEETLVCSAHGVWELPEWDTLRTDPLFSFAGNFLPEQARVERLCSLLTKEGVSVNALARKLNCAVAEIIRLVSPLAKAGKVSLKDPQTK